MRFNWISLLLSLLPFFTCYPKEIEVRLETAAHVKPLYISRIHGDGGDTTYLNELRQVLTFDINTGGFAHTLPVEETWEEKLEWPRPREHFHLSFWKQQKIDFLITVSALDGTLSVTLFQLQQGTSKEYPSRKLTGNLADDRRILHKLADAIHKDLFGVEGIASLRLIYSQRIKDPEKKGGDWRSAIWIQDADGANAKQVTFENSYCMTPSFYPHTAGLLHPPFLFVSFKGGQSKIYRASSSSEPLIELRGNQLLPSLNLKGSQIAFIADVAGRPDLFLQNLDPEGKPVGKARQLYSRARATQASPTFHPDGKKLAFVSDQDGPPRIYSIDILSPSALQKARPRLLVQKNRENTSPAWSPDGKKLAYSAKVEGIRQIWIYDFETEEESPLTTGVFNKENPAWAPDSLHLVYNTDEEDQGQLFLINLHQKEPIQISSTLGQNRFASWETR